MLNFFYYCVIFSIRYADCKNAIKLENIKKMCYKPPHFTVMAYNTFLLLFAELKIRSHEPYDRIFKLCLILWLFADIRKYTAVNIKNVTVHEIRSVGRKEYRRTHKVFGSSPSCRRSFCYNEAVERVT